MKRGESGLKSGQLQKSKTHCPQGHEYTSENTYHNKNRRHCKECSRIRTRRASQKKKFVNVIGDKK